MKFFLGYTDPFLSPVSGQLASENQLPNLNTGKVWTGDSKNRPIEIDLPTPSSFDLTRGCIWLGDKENKASESFKLLDLQIDIRSLFDQVEAIFDAPFIMNHAPAYFKNAQSLDKIQSGLLKNTQGLLETAVANSDYMAGIPSSSPNALVAFADVSGKAIKMAGFQGQETTIDSEGHFSTYGNVQSKAKVKADGDMESGGMVFSKGLVLKNDLGQSCGFTPPSVMLSLSSISYILPKVEGFPTQVLTTTGLAGNHQLYWSTPPSQMRKKDPKNPEVDIPLYIWPPDLPLPLPLPIPISETPNGVPVFEGGNPGKVVESPMTVDPLSGDIETPGGFTAGGVATVGGLVTEGALTAGEATITGGLTAGGLSASGAITAGESLSGGSITSRGDSTVEGNSHTRGKSTSEGNVESDSDVKAKGKVTSKGNVESDGDVKAKGQVTAEQGVSSKGDIKGEGDLDIDGHSDLGSVSTRGSINSEGPISSASDISSEGDINSEGDIHSQGDIRSEGSFVGEEYDLEDGSGHHIGLQAPLLDVDYNIEFPSEEPYQSDDFLIGDPDTLSRLKSGQKTTIPLARLAWLTLLAGKGLSKTYTLNPQTGQRFLKLEATGNPFSFDTQTLCDLVYGALTNLFGSFSGFSSNKKEQNIKIKSSYGVGVSETSLASLSLLHRDNSGYRFKSQKTGIAPPLFALQSLINNLYTDLFSFNGAEFNFNNLPLNGISTPTQPSHAANKAYVDSKITPSSGVTDVLGTEGQITSSGGTTPQIGLSPSGVTPGTYTHPTTQVDSFGRIVSITSGSVFSPGDFTFSGNILGTLGASEDMILSPGGSVKVNKDVSLRSGSSLKLYESSNTFFIGFRPPATLNQSINWFLPATPGVNGQALVTDGINALAWTTLPSLFNFFFGSDNTINTTNRLPIGLGYNTDPQFYQVHIKGRITLELDDNSTAGIRFSPSYLPSFGVSGGYLYVNTNGQLIFDNGTPHVIAG